jgi:DNA adenine methylase
MTLAGIPASDVPSPGPPKPSSLLRYPGSKWQLMPSVVRLLPPHKHFVSVFGGSGAEILCKPLSRLESFNDIDSHIYNLFKVVKAGNVEELERRIRATPDRCRQTYEDARTVLAQSVISDPVESAWAYLVVSHQGFCTCAPPLQTASSWGYFREGKRRRTKWDRLPAIIDFVRRRFQHVQLFQHTWQELLHRLDHSNTCFLLDPPYYPETLTSERPLYVNEMTAEEHVEMLTALKSLNGKALIFNYRNSLYDGALSDWRRIEFKARTGMGMTGKCAPRTEILWIKR